MIKRCCVCIISSKYPGITLNVDGICSLCLIKKGKEKKRTNTKELQDLFKKYKSESQFDCVVAFSGGKDSTYVLYQLKKKYNLRILAVTGEDYFASTQAWENRFSVPKQLGVDHIIVRYNWQLYKEAYRAVLYKSGLRPRAMNVIHNLSAIKGIYEMIKLYKVPLFVTGKSQTEVESMRALEEKLDFSNTGNSSYDYWENWRNVYIDILSEVLPKRLHNRIQELVWEKPKQDGIESKLEHVPFFKYESFDVAHNLQVIKKKLDWKLPQDVGGTETDSRGLQFDVCIFKKLHGKEAYAAEISKLIRTGTITREIAIKALTYNDDAIVDEFFQEFNLSWKDLHPETCTPKLSRLLDLYLPIR